MASARLAGQLAHADGSFSRCCCHVEAGHMLQGGVTPFGGAHLSVQGRHNADDLVKQQRSIRLTASPGARN
jgi:hypothetical protein